MNVLQPPAAVPGKLVSPKDFFLIIAAAVAGPPQLDTCALLRRFEFQIHFGGERNSATRLSSTPMSGRENQVKNVRYHETPQGLSLQVLLSRRKATKGYRKPH